MQSHLHALAFSFRCLISAGCLFLLWSQTGCSSKTTESTTDVSPKTPSAQEFIGEYADIHRLLAEKKHDEAKSLIERRRAELAPSERVVAWEIDFQAEILRMAHGRDVLYYVLHTFNSLPRSPGRENAMEAVQMSAHQGTKTIVVCVSLDSGEIAWSRGVDGQYWMAVDPISDNLYVVDDAVIELAAADGAVIQREAINEAPKPEGPVKFDNYATAVKRFQEKRDEMNPHGLVFSDGSIAMPRRFFRHWPSEKNLFDLKSHSMQRISKNDWMPVSPDGAKRLVWTGSGWQCTDLAGDEILWSIDLPMIAKQPPLRPVWKGQRIFFYEPGTQKAHTHVIAVDPTNGNTVWKTKLNWGIFQYLKTGGSSLDWVNTEPMGSLDEHIVALDASGRVYVLDSTDGRILTRLRLGKAHVGLPFQRGDQLIVASRRHLRSYALAHLLHPADSRDAMLHTLEARRLLGTNDAQGALALLDHVTDRAPQFADAWAVRAEACRALNHPESGYSAWRARVASPDVDEVATAGSRALLGMVDLDSQPTLRFSRCDDNAYVGTIAGGIWQVQPGSGNVALVKELDRKLMYLPREQELRTLIGLPTPPAAESNDANNIPREWTRVGGAISTMPAVHHKGRQFRAMRGGGVRVLDGTTIEEYEPQLEGVDRWELHVSPAGAIGYGSDVYELDENLVPISRLISLSPPDADPERSITKVLFAESTPTTIGLVLRTKEGCFLRVYSRDGQLLNEAPLDRVVIAKHGAKPLVPVGDGYLFSERRLTWVSGGADQRVWDFGPSYERTTLPAYGDGEAYYGDPIVNGSRIIVTCQDGYLLTFNLDAITN